VASRPPPPDESDPGSSDRLGEALAAAGIEEVSWNEAAPEFIEAWGQGEHLVLLGKTGRGKTTFAVDALERRREQREASVVGFVTKRKDETSQKLLEAGWTKIVNWPPTYAQRKRGQIILWPPYTKASTYPKDVRPLFLEALDEIMDEGNWTLYLDEASYMVESLKLRTSMDEFFTQSRSNGITLVAGSQRPVWVSRSMLSQHCWVAAFRIGDMDDARRAGEVMGNRDRYTPVLNALGTHQFLLVDTIGDDAIVSQVGT